MFARGLVWTNILMAGSAAGWVVVTLRALALPLDPVLMALAFCLTLIFYTRDRLNDKERQADLVTTPQRSIWTQRHARVLERVMWAGSLAAVALLLLRPAAALPLLMGLGFALTYTARWFRWRGRPVGWKHLPGMKMPFVAALWTLVTVVTPAATYDRAGQSRTWLLAGAVCALIMAQILLNDLRDVEGDRASGTLSLPVVLGEPAARRIGYLLTLVGGLLPFSIAPFPFLSTAMYTAFLLGRYRREQDGRWRGWIEGQGLVAGLAASL